jgi:hypothetical protein
MKLLGYHVNTMQGGLVEKLAEMQPPIVVVLDTALNDAWKWFRTASPKTVMVGRLFAPNPKPPTDSGFNAKNEAAGDTGATMRAFDGYNFDYFVSRINEPSIPGSASPEGYTAISRLADFDAERCRILAAFGKKAAVGSFSVGVPEPYYWKNFYPALDAARQYKGALSCHAYFPMSGLDVWREWLLLRHRQVYGALPPELRVPLLITECGLDGGAMPGDLPGGWKKKKDYGPEKYVADLERMDAYFSEDSYLVGGAIYTCGQSGDWGSFDIFGTPVMDLMKRNWAPEYRLYQPPAPPPPPPPPPVPEPPKPPPVPKPPMADTPFPNIVDQLEKHKTLAYKGRHQKTITSVILHHAGGGNVIPNALAYTKAIARYHVRHNNWPGIGYTFCIGKKGEIFETNRLTTVSYHAGDSEVNTHSVSICLLGSYVNEDPPEEQLLACEKVLDFLLLPLIAHKSIIATACPGRIDQPWFKRLQDSVPKIVGH